MGFCDGAVFESFLLLGIQTQVCRWPPIWDEERVHDSLEIVSCYISQLYVLIRANKQNPLSPISAAYVYMGSCAGAGTSYWVVVAFQRIVTLF